MSVLADFISYYEDQLVSCKQEVSVRGNIEQNIAKLPGITEHRFSQLQEIEAVLNFLNIQLRKTRSTTFRKYLENYQRELSSRDVDRYVDGEQAVVDMELLVNEVALLRNRYLAVIKGLEVKQWRIGDIVKLRTAGLEDAAL
jgi:hypothetical protein